jgi:hypothetical protein
MKNAWKFPNYLKADVSSHKAPADNSSPSDTVNITMKTIFLQIHSHYRRRMQSAVYGSYFPLQLTNTISAAKDSREPVSVHCHPVSFIGNFMQRGDESRYPACFLFFTVRFHPIRCFTTAAMALDVTQD